MQVVTMPSNDGRQGAIEMGGVSPYGEELRARVLAEALKGERSVREVAEENEITHTLLRSWLKRHYEEHPDDPRRHFIERESTNYKREDGDSESAPEGETGSDDDMAKRDRTSRVDPALRAKILAEVAKGERTKQEIADEHGIHGSTITYWLRHPQPDDAKGRRAPSAVQEKFFAALEEGKTVQEAREVVRVNGARAKKLFKLWSKHKSIEKARAAKAEKLKDPAYRAAMRERNWRNKQKATGAEQQQLDLDGASSKTLTSRPESDPPSRQLPPSVAGQSMPPSAIVRYSPGQQQAEAMGEIIEEAVSERNALRGMVAILQREAEQKDKKLAAYRRLYGDIQS